MRETCHIQEETDETDGSILTFNAEYFPYAALLLDPFNLQRFYCCFASSGQHFSLMKASSEVAGVLICLANVKLRNANYAESALTETVPFFQ